MANLRINIFTDSAGSAPQGIRPAQPNDAGAWDAFVKSHPQASVYHLSGWREVIKKAYNHRTYYLAATADEVGQSIIGLLPLVHLKHFLFGNSLISMPFFDSGGVLANDATTALALVDSAVKLGQGLKAKSIELRHLEPLNIQDASQRRSPAQVGHNVVLNGTSPGADSLISGMRLATRSHKVRMVLDLPETSDILMNSFKAKLRSQIKKPLKEGLYTKVGRGELLDDFYRVFAENMRDLGSPVHSRRLIASVLDVFPETARIISVYKQDVPLACSVVIGFRQTLANPWSSALRKFSPLSPNMLLYWTMLEWACHGGYKHFDFGRSSPEEGTYKFKKQWGAQPQPCHWHYLSLNGSATAPATEQARYSKMIAYWKKLPVSVTRIMGPMIRKHIGL